MDATELKAALLALLAEDPDVRAAVRAALERDVAAQHEARLTVPPGLAAKGHRAKA